MSESQISGGVRRPSLRRRLGLAAGLGLTALLLAGCTSTSWTTASSGAGRSEAPTGATGAPGAESSPSSAATAEVTPTPRPTPTPEPTPTPTPQPTPEPTIASFTELELAGVCAGTGLPDADPFAGAVHPLVVVFREGGTAGSWELSEYLEYAVNDRYYEDGWESAIQLVVCVDQASAKIGSCGTYRRASDGRIGQVLRYRNTYPVRVVVAQTGKVLQSKTFSGSIPTCRDKITMSAGDSPPWRIWGTAPSISSINAYAVSVSTQKVR